MTYKYNSYRCRQVQFEKLRWSMNELITEKPGWSGMLGNRIIVIMRVPMRTTRFSFRSSLWRCCSLSKVGLFFIKITSQSDTQRPVATPYERKTQNQKIKSLKLISMANEGIKLKQQYEGIKLKRQTEPNTKTCLILLPRTPSSHICSIIYSSTSAEDLQLPFWC